MRHLLPCLLLVTACTTVGGETTSTVTPVPTTEPPASSTSTQEATTSTAATTASTVDAVAAFSDGVAASSLNYRFESTVSTGGQVVTTISGVVDHDSVAADIAAGTSVVSYVRTPEGEWITDSEGEWVDVEGAPPITAPLTILGDSTALEVVSAEDSKTVISGTLGSAAGEGEGIPFTITLINGLVTEITYEAETTGEVATVTTTLSDIGTAGIITRPEGV